MDDESDTAKLVARAAKNVTFKLEDDEVADVDVPVSVSVSNGDGDGDEPSEIADGSVEPDMLWLDNTLIAHPLLGIGYFFLLWCARSAPAPPPRRRGRAPVRLTLPRARPPRTRAHRRASLFSRSSDLAAIFPFMFIPAILGIYWWYKTYRDDVSLTYLQSQFIIGFAPVSLSVTFLQLVSLMFWLGFVVAFIEGSKTLLGFSLGVAFYMFIAVTMVEELVKQVLVRATPHLESAVVVPPSRGAKLPSLLTSGVNFAALVKYEEQIELNAVKSNDVYAMLKFYGVEAARATIVSEIRSVFGVYGIQVDPRHLGLIADYMTHEGEYKPLNRAGIESCASPLLKMSFETTMHFLEQATIHGDTDTLTSPSSSIILGRAPRCGTGSFDLYAQLG